MRVKPIRLGGLLMLVLWLLGEIPALAQGGAGLRAGASLDPDQFYLGGHVEVGPLIERLWFRPNLEVGIGSNRTLAAFNGEFAYWIPLDRNEWGVYIGAGPALNLIRFEEDRFGNRGTEAEGGFNILLGLGHSGGLFTELKVGALRSPELKFGVGYTFR
ncbi:MAG: hypothetical protein HYX73_07960 [Acidobacteria bacterium]|nr:hypothetical protein [Acidobacteriota bacterium]